MNTGQSVSQDLVRLVHTWYRPLREQISARQKPGVLREHTESAPTCQCDERFLQILWNEQRLSPTLRTTAGETLEIVSSGTWNVAAGPDFRQAVVRVDGITRQGTVEVHRETADWFRHGHHTDPDYDTVVLHVVWRHPAAARDPGIPCLELCHHVDRPLRELMSELSAAVYPYARQVSPGSCAVRWAMTDDDTVHTILRTAGLSRFEDKTMKLGRRTVADGPDQVLYEAFFEALGYRANSPAFHSLAAAAPIVHLRELADSGVREALLFGTAGLLPDPSTTAVLPTARAHVSGLWDRWWTLGRTAAPIAWQRHGSRPTNSPERRLAAGIEWLQLCALAPEAWLLRVAAAAAGPQALLRDLRRCLSIGNRWDAACTWSVALPKPARLLGAARIDDIIVNVLLPFLNAAGLRHHDEKLSLLARETYLRVGPLQSNRRTAEACHRFLVPPSRVHSLVRCACSQQGLLELYRCFCNALHGDCANCPFTTSRPFEDLESRQ